MLCPKKILSDSDKIWTMNELRSLMGSDGRIKQGSFDSSSLEKSLKFEKTLLSLERHVKTNVRKNKKRKFPIYSQGKSI